MSSIGWNGVKLAAIELWRSGNAITGVMNHASPPGNPTDESGFVDCQENLPVQMHRANCNVWWSRNNGLGLFFMVLSRHLSSSEGKF
jgi:hypothetical protein